MMAWIDSRKVLKSENLKEIVDVKNIKNLRKMYSFVLIHGNIFSFKLIKTLLPKFLITQYFLFICHFYLFIID